MQDTIAINVRKSAKPLPTFLDRLATFEKAHGWIEHKRIAKQTGTDTSSTDSALTPELYTAFKTALKEKLKDGVGADQLHSSLARMLSAKGASFEEAMRQLTTDDNALYAQARDAGLPAGPLAKSYPGETARAIEALFTKSAEVSRREGESAAQAYNRVLSENSKLYDAWLVAKRNETTGGGSKDAREAFSVQAVMKSVEDGTSIADAQLTLAKSDAGLYARARLAGLPQIESMPC